MRNASPPAPPLQPGGADRLISRSTGVQHMWVNGAAARADGADVPGSRPAACCAAKRSPRRHARGGIVLYACPELVRDGWQHADWMADDRRDLLTTGMRAYTPSGVIGRPSEASAEKGKAALDSLTGSFARLLTLFERLNHSMP